MDKRYGPVYNHRHDPVLQASAILPVMQKVASTGGQGGIIDINEVIVGTGAQLRRVLDWRDGDMRGLAQQAIRGAGLIPVQGADGWYTMGAR